MNNNWNTNLKETLANRAGIKKNADEQFIEEMCALCQETLQAEPELSEFVPLSEIDFNNKNKDGEKKPKKLQVGLPPKHEKPETIQIKKKIEIPEKDIINPEEDIEKLRNMSPEELEKQIKQGTNVEFEPTPEPEKPPTLKFPLPKKKKNREEENVQEPQRSDYWKRNKRIDKRNLRTHVFDRDAIGQDDSRNLEHPKLEEIKNVIKGLPKDKALKVLNNLKFRYDVRAFIQEMKRKRELSENSFEGAPGGFGQQNVQGSFAQTPNYSSATTEPWGDSESPNIERFTSSMDGEDHQENPPLGDEETSYNPDKMDNETQIYEKNESGELNTNKLGRFGAQVLGKIHDGNAFGKKKSPLRVRMMEAMKQPECSVLIKEYRKSRDIKKEIIKCRIQFFIHNYINNL